MCTVPKPYPKEFRDDVVRVARNREPGVHLKQIATDADRSENRELRKRVKLLEQENEVLRRAAAYLSQANIPGK
jgi:transposase-like protein